MIEEYLTRPIIARTIPDGGDPITFGALCKLSHEHVPQPRFLEAHHVIPRAWQHFWQPEGAQVDRAGIWHPETVLLCRTGHGNVHYWIQRAVRMYASVPVGSNHSERAMTAAREFQPHISENESRIALVALEDFASAGGSIPDLAAAGLWGGLYGGNDAASPPE